MPNARTSANYDALLAHFNVNGLSHGKIANTSWDALKYNISPSGSYRSKIRTSKALEPDHASIRKKIMEEPVLNCDELWWPLGKTKGVVLTALGKDACLMEVAKSRDIPTLTEFSAAVRRRCSAGFVYGMDGHWLKPSDVSGAPDSHR